MSGGGHGRIPLEAHPSAAVVGDHPADVQKPAAGERPSDGPAADAGIVDWGRVRQEFMGDENLVAAIVEAALEDLPRLLRAIQAPSLGRCFRRCVWRPTR